jgi:2-polyprenyl-6-methoxyphenol hydroxylase-like FAD-dependent oxidoreductase
VRVGIVGAGPVGLFLAIALARQGCPVTVLDRDPGPVAGGPWARRGVMQFHHPHGFRGQVVDALVATMPEVLDTLIAAGAQPTTVPQLPGRIVGLRCRRATFERVLRAAAAAEPGVELRLGHVDEITAEHGRASGLRMEGHRVDADLVVVASGRAGRLGRDQRAPAAGGDCGIAYVSRQHELLPGAEEGPLNSPAGLIVNHEGYQVAVFPNEHGTFSTLVARLATDHDLAQLREPRAFEAACRAIPALHAWTRPDRSRPITPVLPGGRLTNSYQGQLGTTGAVALPGAVFVGDAVCTTTPTYGRGVATGLMQALAFLAILDHDSSDLEGSAQAFEAWCEVNIRPWFVDHVAMDAAQVERWAGHDIDLTHKLPSDVIVQAAEADPAIMRVAGPYLTMDALPASLDAAEARARDVYATGWRPAVPDGPTRDELAALIAQSLAAA